MRGGSNRIDDLDEAFGGTATAEDITTLREGEAAAKAAAVKSSAAETTAKAAETTAKAAEVEAKRLQGVAEKEASTNAATATTANEAAAKAQEAATAARNDATTARNDATTARNEATTARNEATAEANRANAAEAELAELRGNIARTVRITEAGALRTAIKAELITAPKEKEGDALAGMPTETESIAAKRDEDGMVTVTAKATEPNDYAGGISQASDDDPWTQTMSTRSHLRTSSEDTLTVYTDIAVPKDTPLTLNKNNFVSAARDKGNLAIHLTTKPGAKKFGPINSLIVLSGLKAEPDNNYEIGEGGVTGSYRGIAGTYTCTPAEGCNVKSDADGDLTAIGQVYFRPNNIADTYSAQDPAYTWFGWWLRKNSSGVPTAAEVFSGGNTAPLDRAAIQDVTGTATYVGAAAGKFSVGHYTAGKQTDADAGHFDADVSLSARFGNAETDYGSINGAVTNFVLYGSGETDATGWRVTMTAIPASVASTARAAANFVPDPNINSTTGRFGGHTDVTFGGSTTLSAGTWEGSFYGAAKDAADAPGTAAGTFKAGISGADVIGAFGAHKKP